MAKIVVLFLYIIFITIQGSAQGRLLKTALADDVNFMIRNFEEIQVNPYLRISKAVSQTTALLKDTHT